MCRRGQWCKYMISLYTRKHTLMINRPNKIGWWKFIVASGRLFSLLVRSSVSILGCPWDGQPFSVTRSQHCSKSPFSILFHSRCVLITPAGRPCGLNIGFHIYICMYTHVWCLAMIRTRWSKVGAQTANHMGNLWHITIVTVITIRYSR